MWVMLMLGMMVVGVCSSSSVLVLGVVSSVCRVVI